MKNASLVLTALLVLFAGEYQDEVGQTICILCDAGTFSKESRSPKCTKCEAGTFAAKKGAAGCKDCPVGTCGSKNRISCTQCAPGYYSNHVKSSQCTPCKAGHYQPRKGQQQCFKCGPGHYSKAASVRCSKCPPGHYQEKSARSRCEKCPPGTFSSESGAKECTKCAVRSYQDKPGKRKCLACPEGTTNVAGSVNCHGCRPGYHMGLISFAGNGKAGASSAKPSQHDSNNHYLPKCPFLDECNMFRSRQYWMSEQDSNVHYLWFKFNVAKTIVAFSFQVVEEIAPIKGMNFEFYGSNNEDCEQSRTVLYRPKQINQFMVKIESNKKAFICYGFRIFGAQAAVRPPIKVRRNKSQSGGVSRLVLQTLANTKEDHYGTKLLLNCCKSYSLNGHSFVSLNSYIITTSGDYLLIQDP